MRPSLVLERATPTEPKNPNLRSAEPAWRLPDQALEGSRPRDPWFPNPTALPDQKRKYAVGFGNAFTARGDPTSPNATTNGRQTTGYVGQAARPPRQGFLVTR
jgi:hypothetical protein